MDQQQFDLIPSAFIPLAELEAQLPSIKQAPKSAGEVQMIVCRPKTEARQLLEQAQLDVQQGLVGDNWLARGYRKTADGRAHPDMQINIMNIRVIAALCPERNSWPLAGDQFYVDMDLSKSNLPPGTRVSMGSAILEVTAEPHLGCAKFARRFGKDAVRFVNSEQGKQLNLRGINAKVIQSGEVTLGDTMKKLL